MIDWPDDTEFLITVSGYVRGEDDPRPGWLTVVVCPGCAALVPLTRRDEHIRWHRGARPGETP